MTSGVSYKDKQDPHPWMASPCLNLNKLEKFQTTPSSPSNIKLITNNVLWNFCNLNPDSKFKLPKITKLAKISD